MAKVKVIGTISKKELKKRMERTKRIRVSKPLTHTPFSILNDIKGRKTSRVGA